MTEFVPCKIRHTTVIFIAIFKVNDCNTLRILYFKLVLRIVVVANVHFNVKLINWSLNPSPHGPFYLLHLTAKGYI
jgi:hypothetical protein